MDQSTTWKETSIEFKKYAEIVEIISVTINDSSDVLCFDLYLINIFVKYTKAERCTDVMFTQTLYCLSGTVEDLNL